MRALATQLVWVDFYEDVDGEAGGCLFRVLTQHFWYCVGVCVEIEDRAFRQRIVFAVRTLSTSAPFSVLLRSITLSRIVSCVFLCELLYFSFVLFFQRLSEGFSCGLGDWFGAMVIRLDWSVGWSVGRCA